MKLQYLLPLIASALFINPVQLVRSAPARYAYNSSAQPDANRIYQQVNPAVVTVYAGRELGSGSIVSSNGLVITNNHVVRGTSQVSARLADGRRLAGQVIATDLRNDLALIQLQTSEPLPTVSIASGQGIQPGQPVIAIGSPYGQPGVMTQGTFSSTRGNGDLQSRVMLEPGNSGGPLLNTLGQMVGINKAILESSRGGNTGISIATNSAIARSFIERVRPGSLAGSFAIAQAQPEPYNQPALTTPSPRYGMPPSAIAPLPQVMAPTQYGTTRTAPTRRGGEVVVPGVVAPWQTAQTPTVPPESYPAYPSEASPYDTGGMSGVPDPNSDANINGLNNSMVSQAPAPGGARLGVVVDTRTMMIRQVEPGAPGANSGLQVGDRLVAVNGSQIRSFEDLQAFMSQGPAAAALTISRNGRSATVQVQF